MPFFIGISPGEEKTANGIRVRIRPDGDAAWMHGKWLDLGGEHAVAWVPPGSRMTFTRRDGKTFVVGSFPAWVVRGNDKKGAGMALMFSISQFRGGKVKTISKSGVTVVDVPVACPADDNRH